MIDEMVGVSGFSETFIPGPFALAASPARYAVERSDWKGAAALDVRPSPLPHVVAISWFAKALGAARTGDITQAQAAIARLVELRDQLRDKKDAYWAEQVDIQSRVATAWTQLASGRGDEALQTMADAADAEDKTEKNPVTPGPLAPAREAPRIWPRKSFRNPLALASFTCRTRASFKLSMTSSPATWT